MSKHTSKARALLEVTTMFEPSRLASAHLADAYVQVAPLRTRPMARSRPEGNLEPTGDAPVVRRRS